MSDIAHCTACGHLPVLRFMNSTGYWHDCDACGEDYGGGGYTSETYAAKAWTRAVLSDLAAQAREMRAHSQAWPMPEESRGSMVPNPYTLRASIEAVMRDYADLGQNPLKLPK